MPASLTSEESGRAPSSLSTNHPYSASTAASSRATSPVPIPSNGKPKRRPSVQRHHTVGAASLSPPRAFSPPPRSGSRAGMSPPRSREAALLSRVLDEEGREIARMREKTEELARELRVRTEALENAYERVKAADKRTVDTHNKYLEESRLRQAAELETRKAREETRKTNMLLDIAQSELDKLRREIEHVEAEKAEAESAAGRARAIARELKQTMRVNKAREVGIAEGRGSVEALEDRIHKEEMAAAVKAAFEKGRAEGEASATMKALAAFDRLMETDELDGWSEDAKTKTRQDMMHSSNASAATMSPEMSSTTQSEASRAKSPTPPRRKWSIKRSQS